jgi:PAS domain S-box-containing protein
MECPASDVRRATRLAVTQILAEADSLEAAAPVLLRAICDGLEWDVGAFWRFDELSGLLHSIDVWHSPTVQVPEFEAMTRGRAFTRGIGLPGRVWESCKPAWIPDVTTDANFPRAAIASKEGLHGAFAFPIMLGQQFLGVAEFFSREIREPDADLLEMIATVGFQVGQFIERKRARAALQESEQRFARFMQFLPGLAWIKDEGGRYIYANEAASKAFGVSVGELIGKRDDDVFPAAIAEQFKANDRQALATGVGIEVIESLEHGDGSIHHSIVNKFPIPGRDGQPALVGGMAIDITERIRSEEALRESEDRFRTMADSVPVLIWMNGPSGCEYVNREYLRFIGQALDDVLGMQWAASLHPNDADAYMSAYQQASEARLPFESQVRMRNGFGEYRWLKSAGLPRFTRDGTFLGYVGCSLDITDVKKSEEALQDADRRKNEFLAVLAHELRNPLAPISNALQLIGLAGDNTALLLRATSIMDRQVTQMARLIDDLLDVSRITRNKLKLRQEVIELATAINNAVDASRPLIEAAGHSLTISLPNSPVIVSGDLARLSQVFSNLLNNAAKYTPTGGQIIVTMSRDTSQAAVSVRDTGIGISSDKIPHVFEMFMQGDTSLERQHGGLGIGLTLVERLIELHGGQVEAKSNGLNQGSEFVVRLPVLTASDAVSIPSFERDALGPLHCRLLVVDDNKDSADSLATMLEAKGAQVKTAYDGVEAVEVATVFQPDAVLLDIGMPRLNGYEAARRIREQLGDKEALLIAMTGLGQDDDKRRAREAGFDHHFVKPVDPVGLVQLLATVRSKPNAAHSTS